MSQHAQITPVTAEFAVAPQLGAAHMAELAKFGFKSVINNRPDFEAGPDQPTTASIKAAAEAAGLQYVYLPVPPTQAPMEDVHRMKEVIAKLPKPVLAFCRSGGRSHRLYLAAKALADKE